MPDYEIANPGAEALIESFRAVGYSLQTAIADIIDNSVTANAKNIWLDFHWSGGDSRISILDDGEGMSDKVLSNAMRPGSKSPIEDRDPSDLGRFGLGLKTASFSQCRILSVVSKTSGKIKSGRCWDLDYVARHNEWRLLMDTSDAAKEGAKALDKVRNGTLVMWENLDRVVGGESSTNERAHNHFLIEIEDVRKHLAMTFHRFLAKSKPKLKIWINGSKTENLVEAWDPFMEEHNATTKTPIDPVQFGGAIVSIRGYVLPHKDKLSEDDYSRAGGPRGWNAQQGFYIYRNDRMLVSGSWLKLGPVRAWAKEEHYKLARLSIDIPNSMDSEWSLDVKKSMAMPPANIRYRLMKLAEGVRSDARGVFVHRGEYGTRGNGNLEELVRPWKSSVRNGHTIYKIRRDHIFIRGILENLGSLKPEVESMLRFLEETVPVQKIWLDAAENENDHAIAYEGLDEVEIQEDMKRILTMLINSGCGRTEARMQIQSMEPFNRYPDIVNQLTE